ncbi:MAG: ankyrin repeat domain-containing protein [Gemmatimonadota bacterium]|nr:ankyrin repeat domain-containing protein [Gemmatimonadota bacterium]
MSESFTVSELCQASADGDMRRLNTILAVSPHLACVDTSSGDEHRALHHAVVNRRLAVVEALMDVGADPDQGVYPHRDATTPLIMARDRGFDDVIAIIERGQEKRRAANLCPNLTVSPEVTALVELILNGNVERVLRTVQDSPDLVNACDEKGNTVLHHAARCGLPTLAEALLKVGADTGKTNLEGFSPLEMAVENTVVDDRRLTEGCFMTAGILMAAGSPRALRSYVMLGDTEAVGGIAKNHRDLFKPDVETETHLLGDAVKHGRIEMVRHLLDLGVDPDQRYRIKSLEKETYNQGEPLWIAAGAGMYDIAELLLERGADANAMVYASGDPMSRAFNNRDEPMKRLLYRYGGSMTPEGAALECDTSAAAMALRLQPELTDRILWGAACGGDPAIVGMCLRGMDWAEDDPRWYGLMEQPIRIWPCAPHRKHRDFDRSVFPEILEMFLKHGINPNIPGRRNTSLLHHLAATGLVWGQPNLLEEERLAFARLLLVYGAKLDRQDTVLKSTPLAWAARWGRDELVSLYLAHGANPDPEGEPWSTPLSWAKRYGHQKIAQQLLDHDS